MKKETRQRLLNEAVRIADELLARGKKEKHGISWETMHSQEDLSITQQKSTSLYNGVSGIALYLLELYRHTGDEKYLKTAVGGMNWVERNCNKVPGSRYAFLTGHMGCAFAMLRMFQVTKESAYLDKALAIAEGCRNSLDSLSIYTVDDLINGSSGRLLALLHLHAASGEKWLLEEIDNLIGHLIQNAHQGRRGLYWDRSQHSTSGLCGLSHGAAGVGFAFLELGSYFQNDAFYWLAEQSFLYESQFFDESEKNWQDLRRNLYQEEDIKEHEQAFRKGDLSLFTKAKFMNAWCHGAAGIGLCRLRAFELLRKPQYKEEALTALQKTTATDIDQVHPRMSFILCHGSGGNAELFLEAYKKLKEEKYWSLAQKVALRAIDYKEEHGLYYSGFGYAGEQEDISLFMGNAGVGYFYLRVSSPLDTPSILLPTLASRYPVPGELSLYPHISMSLPAIRERIVGTYWPRSLSLSKKIIPGKLDNYFQSPEGKKEPNIPLKHSFADFLAGEMPSLEPHIQECLSEVFTLELEKTALDDATNNHALQYIKKRVLEKDAEKLLKQGQEEFLDLTLILAPEIKIKSLEWNWNLDQPDRWLKNLETPAEAETWFVLLDPSPLQTRELALSPFSYAILSTFVEGCRVKEALPEIIDVFESLTSAEQETVEEKALAQIKQALESGILKNTNKG